MIIYFFKISVFFCLYLSLLIGSFNWTSITSTLNPTDVFIKDEYVYVGTNGGLLILDQNLEDFVELNLNHEIYPLDIASVYVDSNNNILLGSNNVNASIQLLDKNYNHINTVFLDGIQGITQIIKIIEFN